MKTEVRCSYLDKIEMILNTDIFYKKKGFIIHINFVMSETFQLAKITSRLFLRGID